MGWCNLFVVIQEGRVSCTDTNRIVGLFESGEIKDGAAICKARTAFRSQ